MNEQVLKTSDSDVLFSKKKTQKNFMGRGWGECAKQLWCGYLKHKTLFFPFSQDVKKDLKKRWKENDKKLLPTYEKSLKNDLRGYIEYCTRFAWRIVTQVPPLKVDYQSSTFNPSYLNESQAFSFSAKQKNPESWVESQGRKQIKCYVWPTLFDSEDRVIEKGDVVLQNWGRNKWVILFQME